MTVNYDFSGKVALVSGAATGIGKASALAFARAGATVVVADLDEPRGQATADEIGDIGARALFVATDMTDESAVDRLFGAIDDGFGRLDFAHNNVGFGWGHQLLGTSLQDWSRTLDLCLTAPFLAMKREIELMRRSQGGAIVNTASMAAIRYADVASAAYSAAKAGVLALTRYASVAHASDDIRVNAVSPGLVRTEAVARYMSEDDQTRFASTAQPIGRPVSTLEITDAVLWLCSPASAMVTGENICVAGGQQAT
jgi:NAD(P)-dependent dehydrogenase (short-subunit alcohol dehydrogenase family)